MMIKKTILFIFILTTSLNFLSAEGLNNSASVWGGWNVPFGERVDYAENFSNVLKKDGNQYDSNIGGYSFGVDTFLHKYNSFLFGYSIGYISFNDSEGDDKEFNRSIKLNTAFIPVTVEAKYYLWNTLNLSAGIGTAYYISNTESCIVGGGCSNTNLSSVFSNIVLSSKLSYEYKLTNEFSLNVFGNFYYLYNGDFSYNNIIPGIAGTYNF